MKRRGFGVFCLSTLACACGASSQGLPNGPAAEMLHDSSTPAAVATTDPADDATPRGEPYVWQVATESPRPAAPAGGDLAAACPMHDVALDRTAHFIATRELAGGVATDAEDVTHVMRAEGAPYVWPHLWVLSGARVGEEAAPRLRSFLDALPRVNEVRCGTGFASGAGRQVAVEVAVDVLADLAPLPTESRIGAWITVDAHVLVPASAAEVIVLGPRGAPHRILSSLEDGEVRARFRTDQPGLWLVQVLATVAGGPRPVVMALVLAGSKPETLVASLPAPGEDAGGGKPADALARMVNGARASEGLKPLGRDPRLDRIAQAHAEVMRDEHELAHEGRDGSPPDRVAGAGIAASAVGENVAHAADAAHAHRTLWQSPSHRSNLLEQQFDKFGIGVAVDADQTLWVCELFASMK